VWFRVLPPPEKLGLRGIEGKVVAHPWQFDVSGAPRMETIDGLKQIPALVGAGRGVGSALPAATEITVGGFVFGFSGALLSPGPSVRPMTPCRGKSSP
jgi:hypothetical protein